MESIERSLPVFRGGNERLLTSDDFVDLFTDTLDTALYNHIHPVASTDKVDRSYEANAVYWFDALAGQHFEGMRILLQRFHLGEWIPAAPGRYFTEAASWARREARDY